MDTLPVILDGNLVKINVGKPFLSVYRYNNILCVCSLFKLMKLPDLPQWVQNILVQAVYLCSTAYTGSGLADAFDKLRSGMLYAIVAMKRDGIYIYSVCWIVIVIQHVNKKKLLEPYQ